MGESKSLAMSMSSVKDAVFKVQTALFEGIEIEAQLQAAGDLLSQSDYGDVVTERSIETLCGYPLCKTKLPQRQKKGRYKISLKEHKVYDVQETWLYCSSECLIKSRIFSDSLETDHNLVFEEEKISRVLAALASLSIENGRQKENDQEDMKNVLAGSKEEVPKGGLEEIKDVTKNIALITAEQENFSSQLVIHEHEKGGGEKIPIFDYSAQGPSDAIEGYVPQREHQQRLSPKNKGTNKTKSHPKGGTPKSETDFTSTIIVGEPHAQVGLDSAVSLNSFTGQLPDKKSESNWDLVVENNLEAQKLKSALKTQRIKQLNRSVTWADEKKFDELLENGNVDNSEKSLTTVSPRSESTSQCDTPSKDAVSVESVRLEFNKENVSAARLELAVAFAKALTEAADAVTSGEIGPDEAVAKAGIYILPGIDNEKPEQSQDDVEMLNSARTHQIWPNILPSGDEEIYEAQNCWYDSPPEGFCLELSPFAKMWMALDRWITASSVAHIYGRDESDEHNFLRVNGREYPRRIVSVSGVSAEIEKTLKSWISRALPGVVQSLRLSTPISTLEQALGRFLKSMTLVDAIPSFRMKQWHVIVALFLDVLSVHRIPSLGPQMMNKRPLIDKILDAAEMMHEEYEITKEQMLPLGRHPEFSSQSGG